MRELAVLQFITAIVSGSIAAVLFLPRFGRSRSLLLIRLILLIFACFTLTDALFELTKWRGSALFSEINMFLPLVLCIMIALFLIRKLRQPPGNPI